MKFSKKIQEMAVFIEFLAGSGLAIFFHWVLHYPEAAYSIFGIGILLSLATYLLREDIEKSRHELASQYNQAHEIAFALARISDPECQSKAQEMLSGTKGTIALLQQGFIPLDETEFYLEAAKCTDSARQRLRAVDPLTAGWFSRGVLLNYYQSNLRALERGVTIIRIFVIGRDQMNDPEAQKVMLSQLRDGIDVRIAFRDDLPGAGGIGGSDTNNSFDFAIYDDRTATEVFPQSGKFFGRKTSQAASLERYQRLYELIEHSAHSLAVEDERVILTSETLKQAA